MKETIGRREEDLSKLWEKFSLTEEEDEDFVVLKEAMVDIASKGKMCLVGKLIADCMIGKETVRAKLIRGWRPTGSLSFKELGENLFLLNFEQEWDKSRVMEGRPWVFEGLLFSVEEFNGIVPPTQLDFEILPLWVRMHGLPLACIGREIGYRLGATVGMVEEVDANEDGVGWGKYLQVYFRANVQKPLARGRKLRIDDESVWIPFQYQRVPKFCFWCGVIRHGENGCPKSGSSKIHGVDRGVDFGP